MSSYGPVWHFPNFFRIGKEKGEERACFPSFSCFVPAFHLRHAEKWGMVT